ncbi:MAG: hypothetical protein WCT02_00755 [Candidatus Paceibacterota bacterium]
MKNIASSGGKMSDTRLDHDLFAAVHEAAESAPTWSGAPKIALQPVQKKVVPGSWSAHVTEALEKGD